MSVLPINCEIVELQEKYESECNNIFSSTNCGRQKRYLLRKHSFEDDIDKLFNKASEISQRPRQKCPVGSASPHVYGLDSVSLKQALRGLCISQASEMAAVRKRRSRSSASEEKNSALKNRAQGEIPSEENEGSKEKCGTSSSSKNCIIDDEWSEENSTTGGSSTPSQNSRNMRWNSISAIEKQQGKLQMDHMNVLRKIRNEDDFSAVYLCRLKGGGGCFFSMKVMDVDVLRRRNKLQRAETEVEILKMLHHPFLPTLYAHFATGKLICLVMDHCPGGDLQSLRLKQRSNRFSENAARFYIAEILVALEYLHILGIVYRDLKPENVLIGEDGHIVLSSFGSSIKSAAVSCPSFRPSSPENSNGIPSSSQFGSSCIINPCRMPCFVARRKSKPELLNRIASLPPPGTEAAAHDYEYAAPEWTTGEGNCWFSADWWSLGVVLYELLYGRTPPFRGSTGDEAMRRSIRFPETTTAGVSSGARDLMRRLLRKEAEKRIGAVRGAAEIKAHPFFHGVNWALIRREMPPEVPKFV